METSLTLQQFAVGSRLLTPEEYLAQERVALNRSEYLNGIVVAMEGGTLDDDLITGEIFRRLGNQLQRGSDLSGYARDRRGDSKFISRSCSDA